MNGNTINTLLSGKRYLLLQGHMGPFFNDMAEWLESQGREAVNVVFNAGDRFLLPETRISDVHANSSTVSTLVKRDMARIFIRHYSLFWRLSPAASGGETLGASKRSALF
ncbi:Uncharacterised protein [Kluyvera cryocrescens]|uniref:Uncharacterized protein n=1 Tax=Kluyvera cryocrescens TaxID=580 RepID=A0A485BD31_KLUCR|nr:Uncharacterised protein [Kluyvera cryocrescens]